MAAMAEIQQFANHIARLFRPQQIILFGSHARGAADEDSDVDLLIVMPDGGNPHAKAAEIRTAVQHPGFPLDLMVRDPAVLASRLAQHDWFLMDVVEKGRVLYEAAHA